MVSRRHSNGDGSHGSIIRGRVSHGVVEQESQTRLRNPVIDQQRRAGSSGGRGRRDGCHGAADRGARGGSYPSCGDGGAATSTAAATKGDVAHLPCGGGGREPSPNETGNSIGVGTGELRQRDVDGLSAASQSRDRNVLGRVCRSRAAGLGLDLEGRGTTGRSLHLEADGVVSIGASCLAREGLVKVGTCLGLEGQDTAAGRDRGHGSIITGPLAQAVLVGSLLGEVVDLEGCAAGCVDSLTGKSGQKAY